MRKKSLAALLLLLLGYQATFAETEMADTLRGNGKIYVVVVVLATIFAGIFAYLVYLDRKIARMERENNN